MDFDTWWSTYWTPLSGQPEIMNVCFRDIAQTAWNASRQTPVQPEFSALAHLAFHTGSDVHERFYSPRREI